MWFAFLQAHGLSSFSTDRANNTALFLSFQVTKRSRCVAMQRTLNEGRFARTALCYARYTSKIRDMTVLVELLWIHGISNFILGIDWEVILTLTSPSPRMSASSPLSAHQSLVHMAEKWLPLLGQSAPAMGWGPTEQTWLPATEARPVGQFPKQENEGHGPVFVHCTTPLTSKLKYLQFLVALRIKLP